jgi:hypothetical protein
MLRGLMRRGHLVPYQAVNELKVLRAFGRGVKLRERMRGMGKLWLRGKLCPLAQIVKHRLAKTGIGVQNPSVYRIKLRRLRLMLLPHGVELLAQAAAAGGVGLRLLRWRG